MQKEVWKKVSHNKRSETRWDTFSFGGRNRNLANKAITSMYVSMFPEGYTASDLFNLLGCSGRVVEVAILPRRNQFGKRFGFTRFIDVVGCWRFVWTTSLFTIGKFTSIYLDTRGRKLDRWGGRVLTSLVKGRCS